MFCKKVDRDEEVENLKEEITSLRERNQRHLERWAKANRCIDETNEMIVKLMASGEISATVYAKLYQTLNLDDKHSQRLSKYF